MIIRFFSLLVLTCFNLMSYEDLGTHGSTHTINEENFADIIEEKSKDLNTTLLKKQFYENGKKFLTVKKIVPTCKKTQKRYFTPTFIVDSDIITLDGKTIARAGEKLNTFDVLKKNNIILNKYMMFIDATDTTQIQLAYMYKNQGHALITNGYIRNYEKITKMIAYKADKLSIEKFNIKCSPSLAIQEGNRLAIYEYNPIELTRENNTTNSKIEK